MSDEPKEAIVLFSDEVKADMEADPEKAEALREFSAIMRQAFADVESGKYLSIDVAVAAISGGSIVMEPVDFEDDYDEVDFDDIDFGDDVLDDDDDFNDDITEEED